LTQTVEERIVCQLNQEKCRFIPFKTSIDDIELPVKFTFPFYYEPHPLCQIASAELQEYLKSQTKWSHNFGIDKGKRGMAIGKMFGVLVVKNSKNEIGYLAGVSGKLAGKNNLPKFVPPVFDMLKKDSFFLEEETELNNLNSIIQELEESEELQTSMNLFKKEEHLYREWLKSEKIHLKKRRKERQVQRGYAKTKMSHVDYLELDKELNNQSIRDKLDFRDESNQRKNGVEKSEEGLNSLKEKILNLKERRKKKSADLQRRLFNQYQFLNKYGQRKSLYKIFKNTRYEIPPAGSGECAAPKLLQYAFLNKMKPIAMAEFWWGESMSEVRKHRNFYPSCRGKCEPILSHMLEGIELEENPMLVNSGKSKKIKIIYEDDDLIVINKPAELLSVRGKHIVDSVQYRLSKLYPEAKDSLIVHRLDMSTSGLMVIAKSKAVNKYLQGQFIRRSVQKRYVAVLAGTIDKDKGEIHLPLRVDLNDRPRQLVCHKYGKQASTKWEILKREGENTRVYFYPVTGRTHQLRVHAAHPLGLNLPIVGDDLYGDRKDRLHLHAEYLEFEHSRTREIMRFQSEPEF